MPFLGIQKVLCLHVFFYLKYLIWIAVLLLNYLTPNLVSDVTIGAGQGQRRSHNGFYGT